MITDRMKKLVHSVWGFYDLSGNENGGVLHIALDDGNLRNDDILWCRNLATEEDDLDAVAMCDTLLDYTENERDELYEYYDAYKQGAPEPTL